MSSCRPSSSSSASEKTWLSSTSRTRIGAAATNRRLFRREQERVVRLPALLDVHLEVGMALVEPRQQRVELGRIFPRQQGEDAARLSQELLRHRSGHWLEIGPCRDGRTAREAEIVAPADRK